MTVDLACSEQRQQRLDLAATCMHDLTTELDQTNAELQVHQTHLIEHADQYC